MPKKTAKELQNWKRIWQMIRPYRGWMIASMVLAAFTVAFTLYIPILVGNAIDAMVEAGKVSFAIITPILWKIAILAVLTALFQWVMQTMHNKITYQVVRDFRTAAFEKIQKLPLSYLDRHPTGETVSRVITDVDQFADGFYTAVYRGVHADWNTAVHAGTGLENQSGGYLDDTAFDLVCKEPFGAYL